MVLGDTPARRASAAAVRPDASTARRMRSRAAAERARRSSRVVMHRLSRKIVCIADAFHPPCDCKCANRRPWEPWLRHPKLKRSSKLHLPLGSIWPSSSLRLAWRPRPGGAGGRRTVPPARALLRFNESAMPYLPPSSRLRPSRSDAGGVTNINDDQTGRSKRPVCSLRRSESGLPPAYGGPPSLPRPRWSAGSIVLPCGKRRPERPL